MLTQDMAGRVDNFGLGFIGLFDTKEIALKYFEEEISDKPLQWEEHHSGYFTAKYGKQAMISLLLERVIDKSDYE